MLLCSPAHLLKTVQLLGNQTKARHPHGLVRTRLTGLYTTGSRGKRKNTRSSLVEEECLEQILSSPLSSSNTPPWSSCTINRDSLRSTITTDYRHFDRQKSCKTTCFWCQAALCSQSQISVFFRSLSDHPKIHEAPLKNCNRSRDQSFAITIAITASTVRSGRPLLWGNSARGAWREQEPFKGVALALFPRTTVMIATGGQAVSACSPILVRLHCMCTCAVTTDLVA